MPRTFSCDFCGRDGFSSVDSVVKHIMNEHVGKLSDQSIEYLLSQGVKPDRIVEFCRRNRVKVDEKKVYKIALKMVREGKI